MSSPKASGVLWLELGMLEVSLDRLGADGGGREQVFKVLSQEMQQ